MYGYGLLPRHLPFLALVRAHRLREGILLEKGGPQPKERRCSKDKYGPLLYSHPHKNHVLDYKR